MRSDELGIHKLTKGACFLHSCSATHWVVSARIVFNLHENSCQHKMYSGITGWLNSSRSQILFISVGLPIYSMRMKSSRVEIIFILNVWQRLEDQVIHISWYFIHLNLPLNIVLLDSHLLSAYDLISRHAIAVMQWLVGLNTSCCSAGQTQNL